MFVQERCAHVIVCVCVDCCLRVATSVDVAVFVCVCAIKQANLTDNGDVVVIVVVLWCYPKRGN